MNQCSFDAAQTVSVAPEHSDSRERTTELTKLYFAHYGELQSTVYSHCSETLVWDADKILTALAARLNRYTGPITDEAFMRWAVSFVRKEAERYQITATILQEQNRVIHAAIHKYRWTSATDAAIEHDDIYLEIAALVFAKAHALNKRGTAKLSTRITGLVKRHCYLYHNARNGRRRKAVERQISLGTLGVEVLSAEEIASMQADEPYSPGYAEIGLSLE